MPYRLDANQLRPAFGGCWKQLQDLQPNSRFSVRAYNKSRLVRLEVHKHPLCLLEEYRAEVLGEWPVYYEFSPTEKASTKISISPQINKGKQTLARISLPKATKVGTLDEKPKTRATPIKALDIKVDVPLPSSEEKPQIPKKQKSSISNTY